MLAALSNASLIPPAPGNGRAAPAAAGVDWAMAPGLAPFSVTLEERRPWVVVSGGQLCRAARANGKARLMSEAECRQFAATAHYHFIGSNTERAEYPGCVVWEDVRVEYNAHTDERGGCRFGTRGKCACWIDPP